MKITAPREQLAAALGAAARMAPARAANITYTGVHLQVHTDNDTSTLVITSGDGENWLRTRISCTASDTGETVLPAHLAADLIKDIPGDNIDLESVDEGLKVSLPSGSYTLPTYQASTISAPEMGDHIGSISGQTLAEAVGDVIAAVSRDGALPVLTGVRFEIKDNVLTLAATDRYRLATTSAAIESGDNTAEFTIAAKQISDMVKLLGKSEQVRIYTSGTTAAFADQTTAIHTRILAGDYPAWRKLLENKPETWIGIDVDDMSAALKRISRLGGDVVDLLIGNDTVTISGIGTGSGNETIALTRQTESDAEPTTIRFNPSYLLDGLSTFEGTTEIGYSDPAKPIQLSNHNGHTYLAMPRR